MRRVLFVFAAIVMLWGCSKETTKTTYTFIAKDGILEKSIELGYDAGFRNAEISVYISEYFQGQRVKNELIEDPKDGIEYTFEASPKAEYITVRIDMEYSGHWKGDDLSITNYIANVFYLTLNEDTRIEFAEKTLVQRIEPK